MRSADIAVVVTHALRDELIASGVQVREIVRGGGGDDMMMEFDLSSKYMVSCLNALSKITL